MRWLHKNLPHPKPILRSQFLIRKSPRRASALASCLKRWSQKRNSTTRAGRIFSRCTRGYGRDDHPSQQQHHRRFNVLRRIRNSPGAAAVHRAAHPPRGDESVVLLLQRFHLSWPGESLAQIVQAHSRRARNGECSVSGDMSEALISKQPGTEIIVRPVPENPLAVRLLEQFLAYRAVRGCASKTLLSYGQTVRDFLDFTHKLPLHSVKPADVREFLGWLVGQGYSSNSLAQKLAALRAFFGYLEIVGVVRVSPARLMAKRKL